MKLLKELVAQSHCQRQKNMLKLNLTEGRDGGTVKLIVIPSKGDGTVGLAVPQLGIYNVAGRPVALFPRPVVPFFVSRDALPFCQLECPLSVSIID